MSVSDPESWARLRLAQGESTIPTLELKGSVGQTTLTVGQSPGCDWVVRAPGVAPVHFSLHWDGRTLRIADVYGAGGVRADGEAVGAQWRVLSGRVRVDFGKAAIVVEAAAAAYVDTTADPTPLPPIHPPSSHPPPAAGSQRPGSKATLLGVAPVDPTLAAARTHSSAPPAAADESPATESFRPRRPGDSNRPAKPTLLGLSSVPPGPQPSTGSGRPPAAANSLSSATLLGFGPDEAKAESKPSERPEAKAGGLASEQRTVLGFPALSKPSQPPPAEQVSPAASDGAASAVARAPMQSVATPSGMRPRDPQLSAPPPSEAPQAPPAAEPAPEAPRSAAPAASPRVPQAVLIGREGAAAPASGQAAQPLEPHDDDYDPDARYSDAPTRMRNPALLESRRSPRRMPWRYVGVGVLTLAAYFAWLYLLDHL